MYQQNIQHYTPLNQKVRLTTELIADKARNSPMTLVLSGEQELWGMKSQGVVFTQGKYNKIGEFVVNLYTYTFLDLENIYPSIKYILHLLQSVCTEDRVGIALAKWLIAGVLPTQEGIELPDLALEE
jgi:hypothetical protein